MLPTLPDELRAKLQKVALDAYRALRVRDYGRIDMRLTEAGEIYVIEVNASCYLEETGEFATAAAAAGIDYPRWSTASPSWPWSARRQQRHNHRARAPPAQRGRYQ